MAAVKSIRHYLNRDEEGIAKYLEDFVSVPAFIYYLNTDSYLAASRSILDAFDLKLKGLRFQSFLEKIYGPDRLRILSTYAHEVPQLFYHKEGDSFPQFEKLEFTIKDKYCRWRKGVVKLDVAGYDTNGTPDRLLGVFWLDDVPITKIEEVYNNSAEDIFGSDLTSRIDAVKRSVKRVIRKGNNENSPVITHRERQVIHCLAHGLSTKAIANQLSISFNTVETHRKSLLRKFNARNTVQMMQMAGRSLPKSFWDNPHP